MGAALLAVVSVSRSTKGEVKSTVTPLILALSSVFLLLAACGGGDDQDPLADTAWLLVGGDGGLSFSAGRVDGWAGCSVFSGEYTTQGVVLVLVDFAATGRRCASDALSAQEWWMLAALRSFPRYIELSDDRLTLRPAREDREEVVFERVGEDEG